MGGRGGFSGIGGGGNTPQAMSKKGAYTAADKAGFPTLSGSEKQVEWASNIRNNAMLEIDNYVRRTTIAGRNTMTGEVFYNELTPELKTRVEAAVNIKSALKEYFGSEASASTIIGGRGALNQQSVKNMIDGQVAVKQKTGNFLKSSDVAKALNQNIQDLQKLNLWK